MFYNGASLLIQSIESDIDGFMDNSSSVPITISAGIDNGYPRIAANLSVNTINAAAVWTHSNGATTAIVASTATKALLLPPSNPTVSQHRQ